MPDRTLASIPADLPPQCAHGHPPEDYRRRSNGRGWTCAGCRRDREARRTQEQKAAVLAAARERSRAWRLANPEAEKARKRRQKAKEKAARAAARVLMRDRSWMARAACRTADASLFHAADGEREAEQAAREAAARAVCAGCPVAGECLADVLASNDQHAFAGGMSAEERLRSRKAAA